MRVLALLIAVSSRAERCREVFQADVADGDLYTARRAAAAFAKRIATPEASVFGSGRDQNAAKECARAWAEEVDGLLLEGPAALGRIYRSHRVHGTAASKAPSVDECAYDAARWEMCCSSILEPTLPVSSSSCTDRHCCAFGNGSMTFLKLPALQEISLRVRLSSGHVITVEQDGLLRPFDLATVLWPAGYLLMQWVSGQQQLALWTSARVGDDGHVPRVLELGAGTGAASVAAAVAGAAHVLSTDALNRSLALSAANAALAGVPESRFHLSLADFMVDADVSRLAELGPYDLIMGAALQFERWEDRLWPVLERLSAPASSGAHAQTTSTCVTSGTIVALAHTLGAIAEPPPPFKLVDRVPGTAFGMRTKWSRHETDFEVVVVHRAW
jgi:predicted nicotinamide N-methyase